MEQRTDGTSRVYLPRYVAASGHERKKETKRDKRGRGRDLDLDFSRRGIWNREDGRIPTYIPPVCWHRVVESVSGDGYGFLRLAAFVPMHLVVGTRRGAMRVWSGLVGGSRLGGWCGI